MSSKCSEQIKTSKLYTQQKYRIDHNNTLKSIPPQAEVPVPVLNHNRKRVERLFFENMDIISKIFPDSLSATQ